MIDQEQTTATTETTSSEAETTSESPAQGSSTSTTETTEQTDSQIDLAGGDTTDTTTADTTDTTEDTRTDEERAADEAAEAARAELFGAPAEGEEYAIEGLPEGMTIDKEALDAVAPTFRELGLSSKGASKVAAVYAEKVLPHVAQQVTANIEQSIIAKRRDWEGEAVEAVQQNGQNLKNAAGETLSFDAKPMEEVRKTAARALDRIAPAGFREWLKETGLSVHPQMVSFAYQAGKLLGEDTTHESTDTKNETTSPSRVRKAGGLDPAKLYNRG